MFVSRWFRSIVALAFAAVAVGLSLSDRVPSLWKSLRDLVVSGGRALEASLSIDLIDRSDIPWQVDEIGHLMLWGFGMVALGLAFRRQVKPDLLAAFLFAASTAMEVAQQLLTTGRAMQLKDVTANGFGILAGLAIVMVVDASINLRRRHLPTS